MLGGNKQFTDGEMDRQMDAEGHNIIHPIFLNGHKSSVTFMHMPSLYSYFAANFKLHCICLFVLRFYHPSVLSVLALREVWESETPKICPETSKNQCQEV